MSLHADTGTTIAKKMPLSPLLDIICSISDIDDNQYGEKALLNAVGCLANILYYVQNNKKTLDQLNIIVPHLIIQLMHENSEVVTETLRILANLTRLGSFDMSALHMYSCTLINQAERSSRCCSIMSVNPSGITRLETS
jgi:hypothetical protein